MREIFFKAILLTIYMGTAGLINQDDPSRWNKNQIDEWFSKGEWHKGWRVLPDSSIDRKELALFYFRNRERWEKAFSFLSENDLSVIEPKKYEIDGDNLFITVSDYDTKEVKGSRFESHRKYIDIQYVVKGSEIIGLSDPGKVTEVTDPYSSEKDIELSNVSHFTDLKATPGSFFIFFPDNLHRPGLKVDVIEKVRKVVVKIKIDQ